jgi:hypothetical protein
MTRNGRTDFSLNKRITLLQQNAIEWTKNRYLYEAKTEVLYGSKTPKSLQLIFISLTENKRNNRIAEGLSLI